MLPLRRHIVFMEYRFNRTFRNARFTVDALIQMNMHHLGILIEAFARANSLARLVLAAFARLSDP